MTRMNKLPQQYFSTLVELVKDTGLIGPVLQNYPEWLFRAADKWAKQDADYQRENNDPNRLPLQTRGNFFWTHGIFLKNTKMFFALHKVSFRHFDI